MSGGTRGPGIWNNKNNNLWVLGQEGVTGGEVGENPQGSEACKIKVQFLTTPGHQKLLWGTPEHTGHTNVVGDMNQEERVRTAGACIDPPREEVQPADVMVEILPGEVGGERRGVLAAQPALA